MCQRGKRKTFCKRNDKYLVRGGHYYNPRLGEKKKGGGGEKELGPSFFVIRRSSKKNHKVSHVSSPKKGKIFMSFASWKKGKRGQNDRDQRETRICCFISISWGKNGTDYPCSKKGLGPRRRGGEGWGEFPHTAQKKRNQTSFSGEKTVEENKKSYVAQTSKRSQ